MKIAKSTLAAVASFASKDVTRPHLAGVNVTPERQVQATNGHRLLRVTLPESAGNSIHKPVTIPAAELALALKAWPKTTREAELSETRIDMAQTGVDYRGDALGAFPNVGQVIPAGEPILSVALDAVLMADTFEALASIARTNGDTRPVRLDFYNATGAVKITARTEDGAELLALVMPVRLPENENA